MKILKYLTRASKSRISHLPAVLQYKLHPPPPQSVQYLHLHLRRWCSLCDCDCDCEGKHKIVPAQAKKAYWQMEVQCYSSFTSALHAGKWSASCFGHFTLGERVPFTHWIGERMGSKDGLHSTVGNWKTRRPAYNRNINTDCSDKAQSE